MIGVVTITPAAAIDRTYRIESVTLGVVNRATESHHELSGKGVNVARAIAHTDVSVRAVVPLGPVEMPTALLDPVLVPVPIRREIRQNISVIETDGTSTKINAPATPLELTEWEAVIEAGLTTLRKLDGGWLALCGSIPNVAGTNELVPFEPLLEAAARAGVRIAIDSSGAAFERVLRLGAQVDLVKPNTHELAEAVGRRLHTVGDVADAAAELRDRGVRTVYVSMGADGAFVLGEDGYRVASAAAPTMTNTVGAGDASLAGFLACVARRGADALDEAAAAAASWGALAVSQSTTILTDPDTAPLAQVSVPARHTPLSEPSQP
ncbi:1-phosphofructokinase [Microbacterium esteraromaticum]|uniref:1-phosphofructokinase n=1 Tax=Microbacterium esteraromaticum TaxID=57043 RepID=A0A1R4K6S4_9MICO|nr:hexose kinase [Microbacterium esteraromaticum]SJN39904.1 1-phosphofructokinase [Microbacterium esteraromaticum]